MENSIPDIEGKDVLRSSELAIIDQEILELRELKREITYREDDLIQQRVEMLKEL